MGTNPDVVEQIRAVSRTMVRRLGFTGGDFAGTDLSPSAVHALIEIEQGGISARDLSDRLRLEKSSVSRMLRKLVASGEVREEPGEDDGRRKILSLTHAGARRVASIHAFARSQVINALARLEPGQERAVIEGLRLYASALGSQADDDGHEPAIEIAGGYRTGMIGRITNMHARYYAREAGFGQRFESVVAGGLAEFCNRLESPSNRIWTAIRGSEIVGSVAIDGEDMGMQMGRPVAHLRWFIVADDVRGGGIGRKLLSTALAFVDGSSGEPGGFAETQLWTFRGLAAARHLYETHGFVLAEERLGAQWGKDVMEQRFARPRP